MKEWFRQYWSALVDRIDLRQSAALGGVTALLFGAALGTWWGWLLTLYLFHLFVAAYQKSKQHP